MQVLTAIEPARIRALLARGEFFWLDLADPDDTRVESLGELLGLHPLAVEDTLEFGQRPKLDRYDDAVLLVFFTARLAPADGVELVEVHLHIAGGFVVTVRRGRCEQVDALHADLPDAAEHTEDFVVYRLLDALTDALLPVVDRLEERIGALEAEVLEAIDRRHLGEIYRLKQDVQRLERRIVPQHDQFTAASGAILAVPGLSHGSHEYLRDVGDHLAQVTGELYRQLDDLGTLTTTYFNANANRLNRTATRLTVLATFFLIWTLVTSFFGQNFGWLVSHIRSREAFVAYAIGGLIVPTVVAAIYFWRRRQEWQ